MNVISVTIMNYDINDCDFCNNYDFGHKLIIILDVIMIYDMNDCYFCNNYDLLHWNRIFLRNYDVNG